MTVTTAGTTPPSSTVDLLLQQFLLKLGLIPVHPRWFQGFSVFVASAVDQRSNKEADSLSSAEEREVTTGTGTSLLSS